MRKIADVNNTIAVLGWDKEINMPPKGAPFRSQQVATLSGIAHEIFLDADFADNLNALVKNKKKLNFKQRKNVELTYKSQTRSQKFSTEFVMRNSKAISKSYEAWLAARKARDYNLFKEALGNLVEIKKEECELVGYKDHPYEALMDQFEPGAKVADLDVLFSDVKKKLIRFTKKIAACEQVDNSFLFKKYPHQKQWDFGLEILKRIGYDFEAGRQDISPHPFTTNFAPTDVRVTTRVNEKNFNSMTWGCIHEGGHALYEQGLPVNEYGLPSGQAVSLGIHESQSRLWENNVGRSLPFWEANIGLAKKYFGSNLKGVGAMKFFKAINKVNPSLIRVESDELYYHFHILIRYEIEKGLIDGTYSVDNLNEVWNEKYKEYLGLKVPNDLKGILQDVHWAYGSIGYFPTYSLGSFYAAQFYAKAKKDIRGLEKQIEAGDTSKLLEWLRENVHQHGKTYTAAQLCKRITGEELDFKYFMSYARKKYKVIYDM